MSPMTDRTDLIRTLTFPSHRLGLLEAKLAKLNKKADKLDVRPMRVEITDSEVRLDSETGISTTFLTVNLIGEAPVLPGGWYVRGVVDHLEHGNVLTSVRNADIEGYRTAGPDCGHCKLRRNRNTTVVLGNENGDEVQVGKTCLVDFLGHADPAWVVSFTQEIEDAFDEFESGGGSAGIQEISTEDLLTLANAAVRIHGWVPKSAGEFQLTTYDIVMEILYPTKATTGSYPDVDVKLAELVERVRDAVRSDHAGDRAEAKRVIDWARNIPETANDYLGNLRVILLGAYVEMRYWGFAISGIAALAREEERQVARLRAEEVAADSEFVGEIKERLTLEVTVDSKRAFDNDYGTTFLVMMSDADGNIFKSWASGKFGEDAETGEHLRIKGTVKEHETFRDAKQTVLARVAIQEYLNTDWVVEHQDGSVVAGPFDDEGAAYDAMYELVDAYRHDVARRRNDLSAVS